VSGPIFVDTNVLIYLRDSTEPGKQRQAAEWMAHLWETGEGRISLQILQEYYVTVTGKLKPGLPAPEAREDVAALRAWRPLEPDLSLLEEAWGVQDRFGFSYWDSLVVAAAQRTGCSLLLTEDLQHGQDLDGVTVRNPFLCSPGDEPGE
jgi:predicted nucleic acid-binding protein